MWFMRNVPILEHKSGYELCGLCAMCQYWHINQGMNYVVYAQCANIGTLTFIMIIIIPNEICG